MGAVTHLPKGDIFMLQDTFQIQEGNKLLRRQKDLPLKVIWSYSGFFPSLGVVLELASAILDLSQEDRRKQEQKQMPTLYEFKDTIAHKA